MWRVVFAKQATKDAKRLKAAGLDQKAKQLVNVVRTAPFGTPPAYEGLVGNLKGLYARRINLRHRFVYEVVPEPHEHEGVAYEGIVKVLSMWTRYEAL